jgi:hypothetical protein
MSNIRYLTEKQLESEYHPLFRAKTLQGWRLLGKGPRFVKVGGRVFYSRDEIERYLQQNVVETADSQETVPTKGAGGTAA